MMRALFDRIRRTADPEERGALVERAATEIAAARIDDHDTHRELGDLAIGAADALRLAADHAVSEHHRQKIYGAAGRSVDIAREVLRRMVHKLWAFGPEAIEEARDDIAETWCSLTMFRDAFAQAARDGAS